MFNLTSYSLYTQVMLILILIDAQYLQNVAFSFEKGANGQSHSSSDSDYQIKKFPPTPAKFLPPSPPTPFPHWGGEISLLPLNAIWKTLCMICTE